MDKYLKLFTFTFLTFCLLFPLLNWIADPFWYYRVVEIPGFNQIKPKFRYFEREFKPLILTKVKPQAIILGSSYAEIGLDPMHPALTRTGLKTYNFGMIAAHWDEVHCNFHFAIQNNPISQILLGIDAGTLENNDCSEKINSMGQPNHIKNLLSFEASIQSFKVLLRQKSSEATHTREGLFFFSKRDSGTKERFSDIKRNSQCTPLEETPKPTENLKRLDLEGFRHTIRTVLARNIALKIIINPMHAYAYENVLKCKSDTAYWDNVYQVAEALEQETSKSPNSIELWNFTGYNKFMAQTVSPGPEVRYWQDPRHYNFELGNFFMDRMYRIKNSKDPETSNLGSAVTTDNLYSHVENIHKERELFIQENPWFLLEYKSLTE